MVRFRWFRHHITIRTGLCAVVAVMSVLVCSCDRPSPEGVPSPNEPVSQQEYQRLAEHARDVGPLRIHWCGERREPRRLVASAFGADSLVIETWVPVGVDTVDWSDLRMERMRLTDLGCDGELDSARGFPPGSAATGGRKVRSEVAEWLWRSVLKVAYELSDFETGCPLAVRLPSGSRPAWSGLAPDELAEYTAVMDMALAGPIGEAELGRLEQATRSYIGRLNRSEICRQLDVMSFTMEASFEYNLELAKSLLQSLDRKQPHVSAELERLESVQLRWGIVNRAKLQAVRGLIHAAALGESFRDEKGRWYETVTRAEVVANIEQLERAGANFAEISQLFSRLMDEFSERPEEGM